MSTKKKYSPKKKTNKIVGKTINNILNNSGKSSTPKKTNSKIIKMDNPFETQNLIHTQKLRVIFIIIVIIMIILILITIMLDYLITYFIPSYFNNINFFK